MKSDCKGWSLLFTRLVIVFIFLWHGIPKAINWGVAGEKFASMGFPSFLGGPIGVLEVIAAVLILVGFWNKWANYLLAVIIAVAVIFVHAPKGVTAGLERDLMIIAGTMILAHFGPGPFAIESEK